MNFSKNVFSRMAVAAAALLVPAIAFAQNPTASGMLSNVEGELKGLGGTMINVISVIIGLIGIAMIAINLSKYMKGDPSSNDSLIKVGVGLLIAVVLLQVIRVAFGL